MSEPQDPAPAGTAPADTRRAGRDVIAVIGIDRYPHESWRPLANAVADARGAADVFGQVGFEQVAALIDSAATGEAIEALVTDELSTLGPEDSLVLFFAGHGSTRSHQVGTEVVKTGYLIPFDASDRISTWVELESWLGAVSRLPARHILVILDACHSGIALGAVTKWRRGDAPQDLPLSTLRARRSRRIITSALDHEWAMDQGPLPGHSLFTGCLIEALTHGVGRPGSRAVTGTELGLHLQARVEKYPSSRQTPDFGAFDLDDRGELVIPFVMAPAGPEPAAPEPDATAAGGAVAVGHRRGHPWRRVGLVGAAGGLLALSLALLATKLFEETAAPPAAGPSAEAPSAARPDPASDTRAAPADAAGSQPEVARGGCPAGMVSVPAGRFWMGSPDDEGAVNEHPRHEVTLSAYCIDRTEVTVRDYRACMAAEGCSATPAKLRLRFELSQAAVSLWCNGADRPDHPINCVSWEQAAAYCKWAGKRLPTEAEWEYAARGGDGRRYPWGDQPPSASRLNACGSECVLMAERDLKLEWTGMYNDDDGWPMTAPVGSYPGGASPFGVLDMAGNVDEWTAAAHVRYPEEAATDPRPPEQHAQPVLRGGGWVVSGAFWVRAASRDALSPQATLASGVRCARGE